MRPRGSKDRNTGKARTSGLREVGSCDESVNREEEEAEKAVYVCVYANMFV